jgi:hypothetical protein
MMGLSDRFGIVRTPQLRRGQFRAVYPAPGSIGFEERFLASKIRGFEAKLTPGHGEGVPAEASSGPPSVAASRFSANFVVLARASARAFNGKSQHHYIKRFRIAAALTDALDITHAPVFAKYLHARVNDRCDVNEHVLAAVIRLYKAVAAIFSVEFDFSGRHNSILAEFQNGCRNNNTTTDRARVAIL